MELIQQLQQWVADRGVTGEVWVSLLPAVGISLYFVVTLMVYIVRFLLVGPYHDAELERRDATVLTCKWIRLYFAWTIRPLWWLVLHSGLPAMAVTALSFLLAIGSGVAMAAGHLALGGWLYIFGGIGDFFDGRLARLRGEVTRRGAVIDSTLDRYSDAAVLMGLAWHYRQSWVLLAVLAGLVGSLLVSYARAKGEALGVTVTVGNMQRPERVVYLGVLVALSPVVEALIAPHDPRPVQRLAVVAIVLLALSTHITAVRRVAHLLARLPDDQPAAVAGPLSPAPAQPQPPAPGPHRTGDPDDRRAQDPAPAPGSRRGAPAVPSAHAR